MLPMTPAPPVRMQATLNFFFAINAMADIRYSVPNQRCSRCFSGKAKGHTERKYGAVVVGAGPAGLAAVGNLLELNKMPILWVDHLFQGGRLNKYYREVPRYAILSWRSTHDLTSDSSNTKVKRFIAYAKGVSPFRTVEKETLAPNAYTRLKNLDPE